MGRIPPKTPSAGGVSPLSPGEGSKPSSKSDVASFRASEMNTPVISKSPEQATTSNTGDLISKMWVSGEKNELTDAATNAGVVNSLKNAFDQIPD